MKGTKHFTQAIQTHLQGMASQDKTFAEAFSNPDKKIDDCITYILNQVQKSGCNGFHDDEIYSMAVHYYVEKDIEVGKPISNGQVVVNHMVELTEEEKAEARQDAIKRYQQECISQMRNRHKPTPKKAETTIQQPSLFD
ncbi:MAG: PcfK-like family protein [Prevotella sp.]|nr:PcfK-like family protein [Prevotella sp.]